MKKITITPKTVKVEGGHTFESFVTAMIQALAAKTDSFIDALPEDKKPFMAREMYDDMNKLFSEFLDCLPYQKTGPDLTEDAMEILKTENKLLTKNPKKYGADKLQRR